MDPKNQKSFDVVVIGGGVIGASIAYSLSRRQVRVAVLEKEGIASQASGGAAGMLAAQIECPVPTHPQDPAIPFLDLCLASRALFKDLSKELLDETGVDVEYEPCGILRLSTQEASRTELLHRYHWQTDRGLSVEWLDSPDVHRKLTFLEGEVLGGIFCPDEGQVNGAKLTAAFAEGARRRGAELLEHTQVLAFSQGASRSDPEERRVTAVQTSQGTLSAEIFVLAAGAWTGEVAKTLGLELSVIPAKGQLIFFETPKRLIDFPIYSDGCYLVPKQTGHLVVGATQEWVGFDAHVDPQATEALKRAGSELVPELKTRPLLGEWVGFRPDTKDHLPVLGTLPGWGNVFVASGHFRNGILLAPITGRLTQELILQERPSVPLEPFLPDRFIPVPVSRRHP